jgi:hypothetical protein
MASSRFSLAAATQTPEEGPQTFCLYGPPKMGKTTLVNDIPRLFILVPEEGLAGIRKPAPHFPVQPRNLVEMHEALEVFANDNRGAKRAFDHLAIDSLSWVETMIGTAARAEKRSRNLGDEFQAGWGVVAGLWDEFFAKLLHVKRTCRVHIWLIAHAEQRSEVHADGAASPKWDLLLEKKAAPLVRRTVDHVLFMNFASRQLKAKGKRAVGQYTGRMIYFRDCPDHFAGSRSSSPEQCPATVQHLLRALASDAPADATKIRAELDVLLPRVPEDERLVLEEEIAAARGPRDLARALSQAQSIVANLDEGDEEDEEEPPPVKPTAAPRRAPAPSPVAALPIAEDVEEGQDVFETPAAPLAAPVVAAPVLPAPAPRTAAPVQQAAPVEPSRPAIVAPTPAPAQRPAAAPPVASDLTPEQQARAAVDACKDGPSIRNTFGLLSKLALSPDERSGFANELRALKTKLGIGV